MLDIAKPSQTHARSATKIVPSRYTFVIPLTDGRSLAYHTARQTFAVWTREETQIWTALSSVGQTGMRPDLRDFARGGYIVHAEADEVAAIRNSYEGIRYNDNHLMLTIAPTLSCNFGCHYCFQGQDKPVTKMTPRVQEAVSAYMQRMLNGRKSFHLTWYGGEPLMHQDAIWSLSEEAIKRCDEDRIKFSSMMISNGYLMTLPVARKLKLARVSKVQITLDGDEAVHDSRRHLTSGRATFGRILENIEAATSENLLNVSVRVNIDGANEAQAIALLDNLAKRGLGVQNGVSVYFAPVESVAEAAGGCSSCLSKTDYAEAENRLHDAAFERGLMGMVKPPKFLGLCTAMKPNSHVIVPNGDMHKCWDTVMDPRRRAGTVMAPDRRSAAKDPWDAFTPFDNPVCSDCTLLPACAGACAFKFVHNDYASGEAGKLPCPSWKFNLAERLFARAKVKGYVTASDWHPIESPTAQPDGLRTGARHTLASMQAIHADLSAGSAIPQFQRPTQPAAPRKAP